MKRQFLGVWLGITTTIGLAQPSSAQYFGRNKVQYEDFTFQILKTEHFDIYYYPRERQAVAEGARMAERWYARLSALLKHRLRGRQPLILYASHPDFIQTTAIFGSIGPGVGGVTEPLQRRVVLPFTGSLAETDHVLGHELVHAFQFDIGGQRLQQLPLWFIEGMAEYLSLGPVHAQTAIWLRDAAIHDRLPDFDDLDDPNYFPYRFGHAAWAYLAGRWGDEIVGHIFVEASRTGDPLQAITAVTEVPDAALSKAWHAAVRRTYAGVNLDAVGARGEVLIADERGGGEVNVSPALSPDGSRVVFFSERSQLSMEMYVADANTGEIQRKLTDAATDPHLDRLQFIQSTGGWSPDGRQFAIATVKQGQAALRILEVDTGDPVTDVTFASLGELLHPAWSPDGSTLAFAGISGGIFDLYLYRLESGRLERLMSDLHADFEPTWAPDGRSLVFVTDRFTTNVATLDFGNYRLARLDLASQQVAPLPGFDRATNINPQFAPDGSTIYFVANPNGIPNVYRLRLSNGAIAPVTNLSTGVTGITDVSPAISVARDSGRLAYTAYADRKYAIYGLDAGVATSVSSPDVNAAALPSAPRRTPSAVAQALERASVGLPSRSADFPTAQYDPDLDLIYAGAAAGTSLGVDEVGTQLGGGISLLFSDTLGTHLVGVTAEASGGVKDLGSRLEYLNQGSRWHWGGAVQRVPFRSGSGRQFLGQVDGVPAIIEQVEIFRQLNNEASLLTQYPFNRSTRLEFSGGVRYIDFDRELETRAFSRATGQLIADQARDLPTANPLTLGQGSAAFVYDTSQFGATSPVLGMRTRLEVTPIFGHLTFAELLADYRRYVSPARPFTVATRALHLGRYGADADSTRLNPLFLGYPTLVRGYDVGSFGARECVADATSECPAFDQLVGSRMLVGNLEFRVPLVGAFTGNYDYGPLPIEAFLFADTGVAWTDRVSPSFAGGTRDFVSSIGAGFRVNIFGYVIAEFDAVRPFNRPDKSWQFVFAVRPGF